MVALDACSISTEGIRRHRTGGTHGGTGRGGYGPRTARGPRTAGVGTVHLQLRRLQHERDDQRHQHRPEHQRPGRAGRDHVVPAGDGGPDDSRREAHRPLRPEALLPGRPHHLRHRSPAQRGLPRPRDPHPGQLHLRGGGHRPPDPPGLHPDHTAVQGDDVPGEGVRNHQRARRDRRSGRTTPRRSHHLRDQLAGRVRVPGPHHRRHRPAEPAHQGPRRTRPDPSLRHRWCGPLRGRVGAPGPRHPGHRQQPLARSRSRGSRCPGPDVVRLRDPGARSGPAANRWCP